MFTGFTLDWYVKLFHNKDDPLRPVPTPLSSRPIASVVATVIGTLAAIGINGMKNGRKAW